MAAFFEIGCDIMSNVNKIAEVLASYKVTMTKIEVLKEQISSVEQIIKYIDEPRYFEGKLLKAKKGPQRSTLISMLERLEITVESLSEKLRLCESMINSIPPEISASVLYYYYINGLTMEQVARKVKYSRTHCWRLWRKGLEYIDEHWSDITPLLNEL